MPESRRDRRVKNLSLAGVAGLAGFASVVITITALFLGIWLDATFEQRGIFTVTLLVLSVPVSLFSMLKIVLSLVRRIVPQPPAHKPDQHITEYMEEE
jgi:hypothetical protein